VAAADEDALECAPVEFLVVNDENVRDTQWDRLRVAEGGTPILESPADPFKRPDFGTDKAVHGTLDCEFTQRESLFPAR